MRIVLWTIFLTVTSFAHGQVSLGVIGEPALNITKIGSTPERASDSLNNLKSTDYTLSLGLEIRKNIDRFTSITFIPGFYQSNMMLEKSNLNLFDVVHPELPELRDLTVGPEKKAYLSYRQKYVGLQVLFAKQMQLKLPINKMSVELGGGMGIYLKLEDDIRIQTEGFAIKSEYVHIIKENTGIEVRPYLAQVIATADISYKATPTVETIAGIKLTAPLTSTTTSVPKVTVYTPALRLGLRFRI